MPTDPRRRTIETREVLADAYGRRMTYKGQPKRFLSHAVEVDDRGIAVAVLCRRVTLENLAGRYAGDPHQPPTCPVCLRKVQR